MKTVSLKHPNLLGKSGAELMTDVFPQKIVCNLSGEELIILRDKEAYLGYRIVLGGAELGPILDSEGIVGLLLSARTSRGSLLVWPKAGNPENGIQFIAFSGSGEAYGKEVDIKEIQW